MHNITQQIVRHNSQQWVNPCLNRWAEMLGYQTDSFGYLPSNLHNHGCAVIFPLSLPGTVTQQNPAVLLQPPCMAHGHHSQNSLTQGKSSANDSHTFPFKMQGGSIMYLTCHKVIFKPSWGHFTPMLRNFQGIFGCFPA